MCPEYETNLWYRLKCTLSKFLFTQTNSGGVIEWEILLKGRFEQCDQEPSDGRRETVKHAMNWLRTKKLWLGLAKAEVSLLSISV